MISPSVQVFVRRFARAMRPVLPLAIVLAHLIPRTAAAEPIGPPGPQFSGRLEHLDLTHHPMRLSASLGQGRPLYFVFEGTLIPDTMVFSKGKAVGVKALKKGQRVTILYRSTPKGMEILKIVLERPVNGKSLPARPSRQKASTAKSP